MSAPAVEHRFGEYGGQYVPETLMPALAELEAAWVEARADEGFKAELATLLRDFAGRPTPLYHAKRLSEAAGHTVYLKREDLLHTGAHKINNALGQTLLAKRMGKTRIIAETGAGQHGVATATACALLGLECVVYMGTEDMRRQKPNVQRMGLLGATVAPVDAGARTLKEAVSAAIRDWVANVGGTHYVIGSCVGPAPFPALVRDLQRVIGDEARAQVLEAAGRLPDRVIACVGGGSNAIGTFIPFVDDADVELIGVEAAGEGIETGRHGAPLTIGGRGGVLHGAYSAIMQDEDGQILEAHSISAGLDYPGTGPEHAHLRDSGRARYVAVTDEEALATLRRVVRARGHHPGARVLARGHVGAAGRRRAGHARPRLPLRARRQGPRGGAPQARARGMSRGRDRRRASTGSPRRSRRRPERAALMPYLMGGFPDLDASVAIGEACADAGADLVELGVPFSDPLADGPVIHAAGTRALRSGATLQGVIGAAARIAERLPVVLMCYANLIYARGAERFAAELAGARRERADRARPAARGGRRRARGVRRRRSRARAADRADHAGRPAGRHRPRGAWISLHGLAHRDHRRAGRRAGLAGRHGRPREARQPRPGRRRLRHLDARAGRRGGRDRRRRRDRRVAPRARRRRGRATPAGRPRPRSASWSRRSPKRSAASVRARMGVLLTLIAGLVVWVVLWALGTGGFDAFMITVLMLVDRRGRPHRRAAPSRPAPRGLSRSTSPRRLRTAGFAGSTQSAGLRGTLWRGWNGRATRIAAQIKPL